MVVQRLGRTAPVDAAGVLEDFGSRGGLLTSSQQLVLGDGLDGACDDSIYGFEHHVGTHDHQAVMDDFDIIVAANGAAALLDNVARVNLVLKEKGGHAGLGVTVHHSPVDGSGTAVTGQQRGVQVERAQRRHLPHGLGQHPEGDDDEQLGVE